MNLHYNRGLAIKSLFILIIILLINGLTSCKSTTHTNSDNNRSNAKQIFIPHKINWQEAYDDVKYAVCKLILQNSNSELSILSPGSVSLINDTIYVNQEAGHLNTCQWIGKIQIDDSVRIPKSNEYIGRKDTVSYLIGKVRYIRSQYPVVHAVCDKWE